MQRWTVDSYYVLVPIWPYHMFPLRARLVSFQWWGGGELVFKGGYHAQVWLLKIDPKLGFWVDSKATRNKNFAKFSIPWTRTFEIQQKNHTLIKDMGSKSYPNHRTKNMKTASFCQFKPKFKCHCIRTMSMRMHYHNRIFLVSKKHTLMVVFFFFN